MRSVSSTFVEVANVMPGSVGFSGSGDICLKVREQEINAQLKRYLFVHGLFQSISQRKIGDRNVLRDLFFVGANQEDKRGLRSLVLPILAENQETYLSHGFLLFEMQATSINAPSFFFTCLSDDVYIFKFYGFADSGETVIG